MSPFVFLDVSHMSLLRTIRVFLLILKRDKTFISLFFVMFFSLFLIPFFSLFSMRQVQELSITLSLSATSFILLILATLLGSFSIWRDVERRYTAAVLGLPMSRSSYLLGRFASVALVLMLSCVVFAAVSVAVILIASSMYPGQTPVAWGAVVLSIAMDCCKYILLAAFAFLFSALSTSFFLPVFGTLAIYLVGSATQEVMEYVNSSFAGDVSQLTKLIATTLYYLLPNFSAFNYKVQAIYVLPIDITGLLLTLAYFFVYLVVVLLLSVWIFSRRELN